MTDKPDLLKRDKVTYKFKSRVELKPTTNIEFVYQDIKTCVSIGLNIDQSMIDIQELSWRKNSLSDVSIYIGPVHIDKEFVYISKEITESIKEHSMSVDSIDETACVMTI